MFSLDSKFMQGLNRMADLVGLNLLFLVTCIPVITVGASATAMYTVLFRMNTDREAGVVKPYFKAFRDNFRQATVIWLILAVLMAVMGLDVAFFAGRPGWMGYLAIVFVFLFGVSAMAASMVFPLLSQFDNTVRGTLHNALLLSLGYAPRVLLLTLLNVLPGAVFLVMPYVFLRLGVLWMLIYASGAAYLGVMLLRKVMQQLRGEDTEEEKIEA